MKNKIITNMFLGACTLYAGEPIPSNTTATPAAATTAWLTPTVDIRTRYEYADIAGLDTANAFTLRGRLGVKTSSFHGFSAVAEGEITTAFIDDYHGGALGVTPFDPATTAIADPENFELNQAYLQYSNFDTVVKLGRQRLILNNAAFVGNVGWRQNEQTFDGISLVNSSIKDLVLTYAYFSQVNRIFGSQASSIASEFEGDVHMLNASYTISAGNVLNAYAFLMDFDAPATVFSNNTAGLSYTTTVAGLNLYGELAYQEEGSKAQLNKEAGYAHLTAGKKIGTGVATLGYEYLDAGFATPLATAHAFNGFADVFVAQRVRGGNGLADAYLTYATPLPFAEIKSATSIHLYGDNDSEFNRGWEIDQVFSKKFSSELTGIIKLCYYEADAAPYKDTVRASMQLDYAF